MPTTYVRYRGVEANRRGVRAGVFALANGLAHDGRLSPEEHAWWRRSNDWYNAAYPDPSDTDPSVYDRDLHPGAVAWFKVGAADHLLERLAGYLDLLDRHGVGWERVETDVPGRIVYQDDVQVIACPERPATGTGSVSRSKGRS